MDIYVYSMPILDVSELLSIQISTILKVQWKMIVGRYSNSLPLSARVSGCQDEPFLFKCLGYASLQQESKN